MMAIKKLARSKKAETMPLEAEYTLYFIIAAMIIGLFATILTIAVSNYKTSTSIITDNLRTTIAEYRLLNSPECFAHEDKALKRIYPSTIDIGKFTQERLDSCMGQLGYGICFNLELKKMDGSSIKNIKTKNYKSPKNVETGDWIVNVFDNNDVHAAILKINRGRQCS